MTILKIARMGHPVLARVAEPVADPTSAEIRKLAAADPLGFATYAGVNLATRLRRQRGGWVRNR